MGINKFTGNPIRHVFLVRCKISLFEFRSFFLQWWFSLRQTIFTNLFTICTKIYYLLISLIVIGLGHYCFFNLCRFRSVKLQIFSWNLFWAQKLLFDCLLHVWDTLEFLEFSFQVNCSIKLWLRQRQWIRLHWAVWSLDLPFASITILGL